MYGQETLFNSEPYRGSERTDNPVYPVFASIFKKMQGRFWIPENISMDNDKTKFNRLPQSIQDLFTMNLAWQVFADSDQKKNLMHMLEVTNNIELQRCIIMQMMEESNHSGSYQYTINSMYDNPTVMLDRMELDVDIQQRRTASTDTGDVGSMFHPAIRMLALEGISFVSSFLVTLSVHQSVDKGLTGCKNQILKIAADESGHMVIWSNVLSILLKEKEEPYGAKVTEADIHSVFKDTVWSEMIWIRHLNTIHELPELVPERVEKLLQLKANQLARGVGINPVFPDIGTTSSLFNWYNQAININKQSVAPQADDGLAYVAGVIKDDW